MYLLNHMAHMSAASSERPISLEMVVGGVSSGQLELVAVDGYEEKRVKSAVS